MRKIKEIAREYTEVLDEYMEREREEEEYPFFPSPWSSSIYSASVGGLTALTPFSKEEWPELLLQTVANPSPGRRYQNDEYDQMRIQDIRLNDTVIARIQTRPHLILQLTDVKLDGVMRVAYNVFLDVIKTNFPKVKIKYGWIAPAPRLSSRSAFDDMPF